MYFSTNLKAVIAITLLSTLSFADETLLKSDYFLDTTVGLNHTAVERTNKTGNIDIKSIDENGYNLNLALGYKYTDTISFTTTYKRVKLDDIHMDNIYVGSEYTLNKIDNFTPYIGANIGYSRLTWDTQPISSIVKSDYKSGSFIYGATAGGIYAINDRFSLIANYQLELMNHSVSVTMDSLKSELEHRMSHSFNMGIRYYFGMGLNEKNGCLKP